MELDFEKRLNKHLKDLDKLQRFEVSIENPYPGDEFKGKYQDRNTINLCETCHDYAYKITDNIDALKKFLLDVLEDIKDPTLQEKYIGTIYDKIVDLEFDDDVKKYIGKAEAHYTRLNKTREYEYPWQVAVHKKGDNWEAQLAQAATDYLKINDRLHKVINYILLKGGYIIDQKGNVKGPFNAEYFTKRKFTTDLDVYSFAMFIQLCIEHGVFKPKKGKKAKELNSTKADFVKMISENFVKQNAEHFTQSSIENKMKLSSTNDENEKKAKTTRPKLITLLKKMIKELEKF